MKRLNKVLTISALLLTLSPCARATRPDALHGQLQAVGDQAKAAQGQDTPYLSVLACNAFLYLGAFLILRNRKDEY